MVEKGWRSWDCLDGEEKAQGELTAPFNRDRMLVRKVEKDFVPGPIVTGQGATVLN